MPTLVKLIIDGAEVDRMLRSPDGALGRWMMGRAEVVRKAAIQDCPQESRSLSGEATGLLSQSIHTRYVQEPEGFSVLIVAAQPYAASVHDGAKPHDIPNAFGRGPDFGIGGPFGGKFHPGIVPEHAQPFLRRNLRLFGAV